MLNCEAEAYELIAKISNMSSQFLSVRVAAENFKPRRNSIRIQR